MVTMRCTKKHAGPAAHSSDPQILTNAKAPKRLCVSRLRGLARRDAVGDVGVHQRGRQLGRGGQAVDDLHAVQAQRHARQRRQVRVAGAGAHQLQQRLPLAPSSSCVAPLRSDQWYLILCTDLSTTRTWRTCKLQRKSPPIFASPVSTIRRLCACYRLCLASQAAHVQERG